MSHRKFHAPRHGSLQFLPRKRCRRHRGHIRSFAPDDVKKEPYLTAFLGYKAGMTHVLRELDRPGSNAHKKDIVEGVTIIETPPMVVVGLVGYVKTPTGLRSITVVWASHINNSFKRRYYKHRSSRLKKLFSKYELLWSKTKGGEEPTVVTSRLRYIKKYANVVRVVAHSQVNLIKGLKMKKAHIMEIQINGGTIDQKVDFGYGLFEKKIPVKNIFHENETIDTIAVTKGHGFKGVISRWGVTRLPRKTHRGLRKVACIGSWHPARVQYTVARAGQKGYHHRTEIHKKIYKIGDKIEYDENKKPITFNAKTDADLTEKNITPMGGFVRYGTVKQDFLMIKGTCPGPRKRSITLRKTLMMPSSTAARETVKLKFIDTSSQYGIGRFQTSAEKREYFGALKKHRLEDAQLKSDQSRRESPRGSKKRKGSKKRSQKSGGSS